MVGRIVGRRRLDVVPDEGGPDDGEEGEFDEDDAEQGSVPSSESETLEMKGVTGEEVGGS